MRLIGLSLSLCISDIINGRVSEADVVSIESGTKAENDYQWAQLVDQYCKHYWHNDPDRARRLVSRFRAEDRIYQPRLTGGEARNISLGHWIYQP